MSLVLRDNKNIINEKNEKKEFTSQIFYGLVRPNHQDAFY